MISRAKKTPIAEWWWTVDRPLLGALIAVLLIGLFLSFSASPPVAERLGLEEFHFVKKHALFLLPAIAVLIGSSLLENRQARFAALLVLAVSLCLMALTLVFGIEIKGSRRWLNLFSITVQPSEFMKPAFTVIAAWLFAESMRRKDVPARVLSVALVALVSALLLAQPDVGQTLLVVLTWGALLFMAGITWMWVALLIALSIVGLVSAYYFFPHVATRFDSFLDPSQGDNFQVQKALDSLLEGGWFGLGPGEGIARRQLPDAHADFVFSAAAGEFGIFFCLSLVLLIGFIVIRGLLNALALESTFGRLAGSALAIQFGLQASINIGVNLNLIPPKGMTLPFVSYGGTSMLAVAFGMGLLLALTRKRPGVDGYSQLGNRGGDQGKRLLEA